MILDTDTLTEDAVLNSLRNLDDPEVGINIVDLGLIETILITSEGNVVVDLLLTSPGCPMRQYLEAGICELIFGLPGVASVSVRVRDDLVWTPDRISDPSLLG